MTEMEETYKWEIKCQKHVYIDNT